MRLTKTIKTHDGTVIVPNTDVLDHLPGPSSVPAPSDPEAAAAQARFDAQFPKFDAQFDVFTHWLARIIKILVTFWVGPVFVFGMLLGGPFVYGLYDHGFLFYKASEEAQVLLSNPFGVLVIISMLGATSMMLCRAISNK